MSLGHDEMKERWPRTLRDGACKLQCNGLVFGSGGFGYLINILMV
jgi:hypothetical protein